MRKTFQLNNIEPNERISMLTGSMVVMGKMNDWFRKQFQLANFVESISG